MKNILHIITITIILIFEFSANTSATETTPVTNIPDELIVRRLKNHDPSLAISAEVVLYKIRQNQAFNLVDVRSRRDFERLYIPGSVNIALFAVKTKTYLKSTPVVLINEGFRCAELEDECRRLAERGFKVSILDGGLPAWQRKGGQLTGDLFALDEMKSISTAAFFREKDYENTLVIDISPARSEASDRLVPYAEHIPGLAGNGASAAELRKLIAKKKNKPFQSLVIFNETGAQYEKAEKFMRRMGIEAFYLKGGLAGYQKYMEGLLLSWKPRDRRMKTVSGCKPCGEKAEEE